MNAMPNQTSSGVADNIRKAVHNSGLSQRKLAARLGWPQPRVSRRLTGEVECSASDLLAISDLLEVPVQVLLRGDQATPDAPVDSVFAPELAGASSISA